MTCSTATIELSNCLDGGTDGNMALYVPFITFGL